VKTEEEYRYTRDKVKRRSENENSIRERVNGLVLCL
jgi:hypothetical protein